jgi:DNA-binding CsgD family transcriptional regulator
MSLPQQEFKNIANTGSVVLECTDQSSFQSTALHELHDVIGSESSVYYDIAGDTNNLQFKNGFSLGVPTEAPKLWCEHYRESDPFVNKAIDQIDKGQQSTIVSNDVVINRDYTNTEFYCDFLNPQHVHHVMVIPIVENSQPIALIGLHRPADSAAFSEKDVLKADILTPYLLAAIQKIKLNMQLNECKSTIDTLVSELPFQGVIVLDNDLIPIVINDQIYALIDSLEEYDDKEHSLTTLPPEIYECCKHWKSLYRTTPINDLRERIDFTIERNCKKLKGYVRAAETDAKEIFFIISLGEDENGLINSRNLERFKLTRREIDIVHLVGTGMTNPEIAKKLFISSRTVQNHLRSIFSKVGVHNRTSLISRLN